ncbi:MAG: ROK family protein [Melioribacteraceae bacterium]|nr:ROK family protein [Melioribacteraceae bacterium]
MKKYLITVDLGGTKILSALIKDEEIIDRYKEATKITGKIEPILDGIEKSVKQLINKNSLNPNEIQAVCLGVPGTVNPLTGIIAYAPNLGIREFNIKEELSKRFSIPILIENDVNLAGLGIQAKELKDKFKNMLVVFVGTGIGGALFFDGKIYRGSSFYAGEIGHMKVSKKGKLGNGSDATFEKIASRTAVVEAITNDIKKGKSSILSDTLKAGNRIKSKMLKSALDEGDKVVKKHLSNSATVIGSVLGSITTLANFDTIILGGGVIEAMNDFMMPKIEKAFKSSVLSEPGK